MPKLGTGGNTVAPKLGAAGGKSVILADDGMVGGPGMARGGPLPPARLREVARS